MAEKLYYSMGEVAEMFDVNQSLIRHWESQFSVLRPKRNKKGNRLFTPQDVENLKRIYHLVKECGMTLEGAKRAMRRQPAGDAADRSGELLERLQRIRALLVEVREDLKAADGEIVAVGDACRGGSAGRNTRYGDSGAPPEPGRREDRRSGRRSVRSGIPGGRSARRRAASGAQAPPQEGGAGAQGAVRLLRAVVVLRFRGADRFRKVPAFGAAERRKRMTYFSGL